jgi:hypothetical protein
MSVSRDAATAREPGADLLAAPSKIVEHLTNSATLAMFPGWARRPATDAQLL